MPLDPIIIPAPNDLGADSLFDAFTKVNSNQSYLEASVNQVSADLATANTNLTTTNSTVTALDTRVTQAESDIVNKQDILVSGSNIKTVGGQSLLGSGDITVLTSPTPAGGTAKFTATGDILAGEAVSLNSDGTVSKVENIFTPSFVGPEASNFTGGSVTSIASAYVPTINAFIVNAIITDSVTSVQENYVFVIDIDGNVLSNNVYKFPLDSNSSSTYQMLYDSTFDCVVAFGYSIRIFTIDSNTFDITQTYIGNHYDTQSGTGGAGLCYNTSSGTYCGLSQNYIYGNVVASVFTLTSNSAVTLVGSNTNGSRGGGTAYVYATQTPSAGVAADQNTNTFVYAYSKTSYQVDYVAIDSTSGSLIQAYIALGNASLYYINRVVSTGVPGQYVITSAYTNGTLCIVDTVSVDTVANSITITNSSDITNSVASVYYSSFAAILDPGSSNTILIMSFSSVYSNNYLYVFKYNFVTSVLDIPGEVLSSLSLSPNYISVSSNNTGSLLLAYGSPAVKSCKYIPTAYSSTNYSNTIGLADKSIPDGQQGDIGLYYSLNANFTNLQVGATYYVQYDGLITTTPIGNNIKIGVAINSTTIRITEQYL